MNKSGQTIFLGVVIGLFLFMVGVLILNLLTPEITTARNSDNLDCSNSAISDGVKVTCLVISATIPYYIIAFVSVVLGLVIGRLV